MNIKTGSLIRDKSSIEDNTDLNESGNAKQGHRSARKINKIIALSNFDGYLKWKIVEHLPH